MDYKHTLIRDQQLMSHGLDAAHQETGFSLWKSDPVCILEKAVMDRLFPASADLTCILLTAS